MQHEHFINAGFSKIEGDPFFIFEKELLNPNEDELSLKILYGSTGMNDGFCLGFEGNFIFFNAKSPEEASEWASKISVLEPSY